MKISLEWLSDHVKLPARLTAEEIAHTLTMATVEVEQVTHLADSLAHVVVGRIRQVERHPNAERLSVAMCDIGCGRNAQLVSAGIKIRPEQLVAVALPGATVRDRGGRGRIAVAERNVRGVASFGMICGTLETDLESLFPAAHELDVLELSELHVETGVGLAQAIGFDDVILEIDNKSLTNRPDLLGHRGIARELSAIYSVPLEPLACFEPPARGDLRVEIEDPGRCRRYTATRIAGLAAIRSPFWLRSRLARVGQRPITLPVDLTNYVMLALGQPSHAFDTGRLEGAIRVRQAQPREQLQLLDGEILTLDERALVIADDRKAVALAGIMGGKDSSIGEETREIVLEIANFEPSGVRRTAGRMNLRTESSTRFEKGLDPQLIDEALGLFFDALARAEPGAKATGFIDNYPAPIEPPTIETTVDFINRRLGANQSQAEINGILERLGFGVAAEDSQLRVAVPSWRATGDVSLPEDLVEEVGRLVGYENLEFAAPEIKLKRMIRQPELSLDRRIREYLAGSGAMQEIVSYPWVEERYLAAAGFDPPLGLATPPAPETQRLQNSLIPQMLAAVRSNLRFLRSFRLFEVARVFPGGALELRHQGGEMLPPQPKHVAAVLVGPGAGELFLEAKGLLEALGREVQMQPLNLASGSEPTWAEPGGYLDLRVGEQMVGELGVVSTRAMRLAGIRHANVVLFEIDLSLLQPNPSRENVFEPLPVFPQKDYDLSLLVAVEVQWEDLYRQMSSAHELVRSVRLVEEYRGEQVPAGKKSLLVQVRMGANDRTLDANAVDEVAAILAGLAAREFGAELRGSVRGA